MENFESHTSLPNKAIATKFIFIKNLKSVGRESKSNKSLEVCVNCFCGQQIISVSTTSRKQLVKVYIYLRDFFDISSSVMPWYTSVSSNFGFRVLYFV